MQTFLQTLKINNDQDPKQITRFQINLLFKCTIFLVKYINVNSGEET